MINNPNIVRDAELEYLASHIIPLKKRLELLDEMFLFARKFENKSIPPEETPHVKMLINLSKTMKKIGYAQKCLKKPS